MEPLCDGTHCTEHLCTEDIPILSGLEPEKQKWIASRALHRSYQQGECLFHDGDPIKGIFILHTGSVKLTTYDGDGNEKIVGIFSAGEVILDGIFTPSRTYRYTAEVIAPARICVITTKDFSGAIDSMETAYRVIRLLSEKLSDAKMQNALLTTHSQLARVAGFLLYMARRSGTDEVTLLLNDLGASLNMRPETVSRKIRELINLHLIMKAGQSRILDFEGLKEIFDSGGSSSGRE